jgi:hypothetical protein
MEETERFYESKVETECAKRCGREVRERKDGRTEKQVGMVTIFIECLPMTSTTSMHECGSLPTLTV